MSWVRGVEFWCDTCEAEEFFMGPDTQPWETAKGLGWTDDGKFDICPSCNKEE